MKDLWNSTKKTTNMYHKDTKKLKEKSSPIILFLVFYNTTCEARNLNVQCWRRDSIDRMCRMHCLAVKKRKEKDLACVRVHTIEQAIQMEITRTQRGRMQLYLCTSLFNHVQVALLPDNSSVQPCA